VAIVAEEFCQGIRSGLSYCGGHTIERARDRAEFIRVAPGARKEREGSHRRRLGEDQRGQRDEASLRLGRRNGGRKRRLTTEQEPKGGFASTTGPRLRRVTVCRSHGALLTPSGHPLRMPDAFGRAIRDHHRGDRTTLSDRATAETREHPIGAFYFDAFDAESNAGSWLTSRLSGPLVDLGRGGPARAAVSRAVRDSCGRDQPSTRRGDARPRRRGCREGDMFALRDAFEQDRFASALAIGTQIGLAGSMRGSRHFSATSRS